MPATPTVAELRLYLEERANRWPDDADGNAVLQRTIDVERAAQLKVCTIPANPTDALDTDYLPIDLQEALLRRCDRNLAIRPLPLGIQQGVDGTPGLRISRFDAEIGRLEFPYSQGPLCG